MTSVDVLNTNMAIPVQHPVQNVISLIVFPINNRVGLYPI
jgi:hypothetical protein